MEIGPFPNKQFGITKVYLKSIFIGQKLGFKTKIVQEVDFDVFVTGPDQCHAGFQRAIQGCEKHGREHIVLGRTDGVSSSELKAKIAEKTKL